MFGHAYHGHQQIFFENLSPVLYMHQHSPNLTLRLVVASSLVAWPSALRKPAADPRNIAAMYGDVTKNSFYPGCLTAQGFSLSERADRNRSTNVTCAVGRAVDCNCLSSQQTVGFASSSSSSSATHTFHLQRAILIEAAGRSVVYWRIDHDPMTELQSVALISRQKTFLSLLLPCRVGVLI
jgi:hypothetical protein